MSPQLYSILADISACTTSCGVVYGDITELIKSMGHSIFILFFSNLTFYSLIVGVHIYESATEIGILF